MALNNTKHCIMDIEWSFYVVIILSPCFFFFSYGYLLTKLVKFLYNHSSPCVLDVSGCTRRKCNFSFGKPTQFRQDTYLHPRSFKHRAKYRLNSLLNSTATRLLHFGAVQGVIVFKTSSRMKIILRIADRNKRNFTQIEQFLRKPDVRSHRCDSQWNTGCLSKLRLNLHCFV